MTTPICPCCGYSLEADAVIERDGWVLDPRGAATFEGIDIKLRPAWCRILSSLASADGRLLSTEALLARHSDSENPNVVASSISQMRKALRAQRAPMPIETVRSGPYGGGYRWRVAA